MYKKIIDSDIVVFGLGIFLAISTLILPNVGINFFGINIEDIPFILVLLFLIVFQLIQKKFEINFLDSVWIYLGILFILFSLVSSFNNFFKPMNLRFIVYILFGYLFYKFSLSFRDRSKFVKLLLLPIGIVPLTNLVVYITKYTSPDLNNGWIQSHFELTNIFNEGRLAGLQGGGPNVLGALLGLSTITFLHYTIKEKDVRYKSAYGLILIISIFCLFLTFSRGSYVAIFLSLILYLYLETKDLKILFISGTISILLGALFLYFGNSQILLKDSDRALLSDIAVKELEVFNGVGGGQYITAIYGSYLLALDPELIMEQYNLSIDQIDSGIIPEGYEGEGDFLIVSSGGGYEILQAAKIADKCTGNRTTCQNSRVDLATLSKFFPVVKDIKFEEINAIVSNSECLTDYSPDYLVTRSEYACLNNDINIQYNQKYVTKSIKFVDTKEDEDIYFSSLVTDGLFKQCEMKDIEKTNLTQVKFACPSRKLAIGELSATTEDLVLRDEVMPLDDFTLFCEGCDLREVKGWLKVEFDKYDNILPRSIFRFYTSKNGIDWVQLGYDHTPGYVVEFTENDGVIEIGSWVDGQSFGNTWLSGDVNKISVNTKAASNTIEFIEDDLNDTFNVYIPGTMEDYTAKITFTDYGLRLYNPAKYWLNIKNQGYNFNDDFEIILNLNIPEIIWEESNLVSLTSGFGGQAASWKWIADDGRLFFTWTNEEGEFKYLVGDRSLRSGLLYAGDSFFESGSPPTVDSAHLSQMTTAHNGFLTFAVEYGVILSIIVLSFFLYALKIGIKKGDEVGSILTTLLSLLLIQNLTNDLIYAPDTALYFWITTGILISLKE